MPFSPQAFQNPYREGPVFQGLQWADLTVSLGAHGRVPSTWGLGAWASADMHPSMCNDRRQGLILQIHPAEPTLGCRDIWTCPMCLPVGIWDRCTGGLSHEERRHSPSPWILQLEYQRNQNFIPSVGKVHVPVGKLQRAERATLPSPVAGQRR